MYSVVKLSILCIFFIKRIYVSAKKEQHYNVQSFQQSLNIVHVHSKNKKTCSHTTVLDTILLMCIFVYSKEGTVCVSL